MGEETTIDAGSLGATHLGMMVEVTYNGTHVRGMLQGASHKTELVSDGPALSSMSSALEYYPGRRKTVITVVPGVRIDVATNTKVKVKLR